MKYVLPFLVLIPLCAALNRARGTKAWCAHLYGLVVAVLLVAYLRTWWFAAFYPLFLFGECWGWGTMIGGILDGDSATKELYRMHLSVRGAWWWTACLILFSFMGCPVPVVLLSVYVLAIMFPLSLAVAKKFKSNSGDAWCLAEWIYGAIHGAVLAACIVMVK